MYTEVYAGFIMLKKITNIVAITVNLLTLCVSIGIFVYEEEEGNKTKLKG